MKKVMFISSGGGHLAELLKIDKIFNNYNYVLVTEKNSVSLNLKNKYKMEYLLSGSRSNMIKYIPVIFINTIKSLYLFLKYKPDLIYTTGVHTCVAMCFIGHIFKKKIIYVEVFDRINNPTLTSKIIQNITDLNIVQHEEMLEKVNNSIYFGGVY